MKKIIVFALLCLAIGATAQAQSRLEHLKIKSQILGVEKDYSIYLPDGYDNSTERYPVLYLLHCEGRGCKDDCCHAGCNWYRCSSWW